MPQLSPNIENRVRKLPKPSNHSQGMQPLFEAISNAFYAIEDLNEKNNSGDRGLVKINVSSINQPEKLKIEVVDYGIGLDKDRYDAFCEVDTPFKKEKGGKGVGRLFWLDAFADIKVESLYLASEGLKRRCFKFDLNNEEQIIPVDLSEGWTGRQRQGTTIIFEGLRTNDYSEHFPKRFDTFLRYFSAHFIADFLVGKGPKVTVNIDGDVTEYPKEVKELVVGDPADSISFSCEEFGDLSINGFNCKPEASTGLDGNHQLHLLANGRTVESRKVDNLVGLESVSVGDEAGLYFHACVSGEYLNDRVNEGRTAFNLPEKLLKELTRICIEQVKNELLPDQVQKYEKEREDHFNSFVNKYPIYGFEDAKTQLSRVPFHAKKPEDFAAGLVKYKIRRDEERQDAIQDIINILEGSEDIPEDFSNAIIKATGEIQNSEKLALAQHVVRRKLVLELLEKLLKRIRKKQKGDDDYHLEETLHSFICPMHIRGDDPSEIRPKAHDLWIVDERLAFTRAFSSDKRLDSVLKEGGSAQRPDLFIWNLAYGMGFTDPEKNAEKVDLSEPLTRMLVVEFKRPGRQNYDKAEDQIEQQIIKYLSQLKGGELETFDREKVSIAEDCIFYCYVIADIDGDLELQLSSWDKTSNGRGRFRVLSNEYRGSIEVIQWKDLVNDAWHRNLATLDAAGLKRSIPTKID